jgi:hypothetical protein
MIEEYRRSSNPRLQTTAHSTSLAAMMLSFLFFARQRLHLGNSPFHKLSRRLLI